MNKWYSVPMQWCTKLVWDVLTGESKSVFVRRPAPWLRPKLPVHGSDPWKEWFEMKRYQQEIQKVDKKWVAPGDEFLANFPHVAQLCTDAWWDDGKPREVCGLTLRFGLGTVQLSINDADLKQSATTTAETVLEALNLMEEGFACGKSMWRKWKQFNKRN